MGYNDAAMELAQAHAFLADWYGENGGDSVALRVEAHRGETGDISTESIGT